MGGLTNLADEHPHPPGFDELWAESWHLDFAGPGGLGGYVTLCLYPNLRSAWWWTGLVGIEGVPQGADRPGLVAVRDHEVPLPRTGLAVRGEGLWADLVCETPLEHWSLGLEAFGVAYDDPEEAWRSEWGERIPVGLDLEWEALGPPGSGILPGPPGPPGAGYAQPGTVTGEILVGELQVPFDGTGVRAHRWGVADWWTGAARGWAGMVGPDGQLALIDLGDTSGEVEVVARAPVLVTGPQGRTARLLRALGRAGERRGWAEWLLP